jgi:hypothetical protein
MFPAANPDLPLRRQAPRTRTLPRTLLRLILIHIPPLRGPRVPDIGIVNDLWHVVVVPNLPRAQTVVMIPEEGVRGRINGMFCLI